MMYHQKREHNVYSYESVSTSLGAVRCIHITIYNFVCFNNNGDTILDLFKNYFMYYPQITIPFQKTISPTPGVVARDC